jgi:SPP1 gp7 family putative phage head morphogenesis protein
MTIDVDALDLDDGDEIEALMRRFYPLLLSSAYADAGATIGMDLAFDLANEHVQKVLHQLAQKVRDVAQTTRDDIRAKVAQAAAEGWSTDRLASELQQLREIASATRAQVIARTEAASAYSRGSLLAYTESGVVHGTQWLVSDPCPICEPLTDTVVALGERFGGEFEAPPAHPACRCAIAPVLKD